jgi:hypothetical protein
MLRGGGRNCHPGTPAFSPAKPSLEGAESITQREEFMDITALLIQLVSGAVGGKAT